MLAASTLRWCAHNLAELAKTIGLPPPSGSLHNRHGGPGLPARSTNSATTPGPAPSGRRSRKARRFASSPQRLFPAGSACFRHPAGRTTFLWNPSQFCRQDADSTLVAAENLATPPPPRCARSGTRPPRCLGGPRRPRRDGLRPSPGRRSASVHYDFSLEALPWRQTPRRAPGTAST